MAKPKITLFVDIVSPFAYMGFHALRVHKDAWIMKERLRWAKLFNIPICEETPEGFPPNTISAQRALCAIEGSSPDKLADAIDALYQAFWVRSETIQKTEVVAKALASALGKEGAEKVMGQLGSAEVKKRLSGNTDKAFGDGAFGLPWFVATNSKGETEGYWGFDHIGQMVDFLGLERPTSGGWKAML
ncbi:hypothetical protein LTS18_013595 [Coniosporium uncinatum]|uniref:Uncharacterized protein n=1 Tax=Coniosporium uncinatum TaxID=93489 RepID=A0ACC3DVM4_9PEZI|nr:hypothetical protein LTS18_013595 [Coniosporium uncinatum]